MNTEFGAGKRARKMAEGRWVKTTAWIVSQLRGFFEGITYSSVQVLCASRQNWQGRCPSSRRIARWP